MKITYLSIYQRLYDFYGPQHWWPAKTAFEMMIGAILVQNTSWKNAEMALEQLRPYLEPETLEQLEPEKIAALIRPSGYYNMKAKKIKSFLKWFKGYHYQIDTVKKVGKEKLRNELLKVYGIGKETADALLVYAFDYPVFIVDAYARRIFYRVGFDMPKDYDAFRREVEREIPQDLQLMNEYHALLVEHGKIFCKKKPVCEGCPLFSACLQRME